MWGVWGVANWYCYIQLVTPPPKKKNEIIDKKQEYIYNIYDINIYQVRTYTL